MVFNEAVASQPESRARARAKGAHAFFAAEARPGRLFGRPAAPRGGVAGTNIDPKNRQKKKQQKPLARGDEGAGGASNGEELDAGRGAMCKGKRGQPFDVEFACLSRVGVGTGLYQIERALGRI